MNQYIKQRGGQSFEDRAVEKCHPVIRDAVREKINNFEFKIQFHEATWVIKQYTGGFEGGVLKRELVELEGGIPFGVISVDKDKKKQCSDILVWSDGRADGNRCWLINVANGLFKQVNDENQDKAEKGTT